MTPSLFGVLHTLRNHFWGSRETPSPLCNIVIIWAYCDHLEGHRPPYPRLRNMCTTPYHSGYKNDRSALVDIFFTGSKKLRLFGSFAYLCIIFGYFGSKGHTVANNFQAEFPSPPHPAASLRLSCIQSLFDQLFIFALLSDYEALALLEWF